MNRSKGTLQLLLTGLLRIILNLICYTGNAKFARLKNAIGQVELTSGRTEVHSQGSVQSKGGIEAIVFTKRFLPVSCLTSRRALESLMRGVPAILEKLLGCALNKASFTKHLQILDANYTGILLIRVSSTPTEIVVINFELCYWCSSCIFAFSWLILFLLFWYQNVKLYCCLSILLKKYHHLKIDWTFEC